MVLVDRYNSIDSINYNKKDLSASLIETEKGAIIKILNAVIDSYIAEEASFNHEQFTAIIPMAFINNPKI